MKNVFPSNLKCVVTMASAMLDQLDEVYRPVDCNFTDELEYLSIHKIEIRLIYKSGCHLSEHTGKIEDIFTKKKEEFILMTDDLVVRLDHICQIRIL